MAAVSPSVASTGSNRRSGAKVAGNTGATEAAWGEAVADAAPRGLAITGRGTAIRGLPWVGVEGVLGEALAVSAALVAGGVATATRGP